MRVLSLPSPLRFAPLLLASALAACSGSDSDSSDFTVTTTGQAATPAAPIVLAGDWLVYLASENFTGPAGTNFNANGTDMDTMDDVAFVVDIRARLETNLGVAALGAVIVGTEIYVVVDETLDSFDWDGGGIGGIVLLHWSAASGVVVLVDTLEQSFAGELPQAVDGRLYYAAATGALGMDETNLRMLEQTAPTTPVTIMNEIGAGAVEAHPVGAQQGLLVCVIDENDDGLDHNNDGDFTDEFVLALLDGTDPMARLKSVELAMSDEDDPVAVRSTGANDWQVAFPVDEAFQGNTNLNDQTLFNQPLLPDNCLGITDDMDMLDRIVHYLDFADFLAGISMPVNTGLVGGERIVLLDGFVATVSDEGDSSCNLNAATGDMDMNDDIVRWVATVMPVAPARAAEDLHAVEAVPGGSCGLTVLDNRLLAVISESDDSANHDGKLLDHDLVAWVDPADANPTWQFSHQSTTNSTHGTGVFDDDGDSEPFVGTTWMSPEAVAGRVAMVFLEQVPGTNADIDSLNTNLDCDLVAKDADKTDGLPVWADFEAGPTLDLDGVGYSVDKSNAGIELTDDFAFFRVSEADDNRDYNNDGFKNDVVLFRNPLRTCGPVGMATSSMTAGQVITTDRMTAAAFLSSESLAGIDFNMDGDMTDQVVRYFRF